MGKIYNRPRQEQVCSIDGCKDTQFHRMWQCEATKQSYKEDKHWRKAKEVVEGLISNNGIGIFMQPEVPIKEIRFKHEEMLVPTGGSSTDEAQGEDKDREGLEEVYADGSVKEGTTPFASGGAAAIFVQGLEGRASEGQGK